MKSFYFRWPPYPGGRVRRIILSAFILFLAIFILQSTFKSSKTKNQQFHEEPTTTIFVDGEIIKDLFFILGLDVQAYKNILASNLPPVGSTSVGDSFFITMLQTLADVELSNPRSFFGQGVMNLGAMEVMAASAVERNPLFEDEGIVDIPPSIPPESKGPPPNKLEKDQPVRKGAEIILINTHNAETYRATDGVSKREGENAGVVQAAQRLEMLLSQEFGLTVERSDRIHDYPKFDEAYSNSARTLEELLKKNPQARVVIDIHRDAGYSKPLTATINGKKAAQIRLIVGSDNRLPHPNWLKNREFARQITEKMDVMYPGLSLGYRVQSGRYNQHMHPRSILMEVGNDYNSLEEAYYAMKLFGTVLNTLLTE